MFALIVLLKFNKNIVILMLTFVLTTSVHLVLRNTTKKNKADFCLITRHKEVTKKRVFHLETFIKNRGTQLNHTKHLRFYETIKGILLRNFHCLLRYYPTYECRVFNFARISKDILEFYIGNKEVFTEWRGCFSLCNLIDNKILSAETTHLNLRF